MNLINKMVDLITGKPNLIFRDKINKDKYIQLKRLNKLYSSSAKSLRKAAVNNEGNVRQRLRLLKIREGQLARLYHVSLCFLKGKKYSEVELNVNKNNRIYSDQIYDLLFNSVNDNYKQYLAVDIKRFLKQ